jgi:hypothetical protein
MKGHMLRSALAALTLAAACAAHAAGPLFVCEDHTPAKLPGAGLLTLNLDQGNLGTRTNAQAAAIIGNAIASWNSVGRGNWATAEVSRGADLAQDITFANYTQYVGNFNDGVNPVVYDNDGAIIDALMGAGASDSLLGVWGTTIKSSSPCELGEAQMVLNGKLAMSDATLTSVVTKNIGFFMGLDQAQLDGSQAQSQANYPVMYPFPYRTAPGVHLDDLTSLMALYPGDLANPKTTFGILRGTFVAADGTPILGANIWAENLNTNQIVTSPSDYLGRGNGEFRLFLTQGLYRLHAEAIEPGFQVGRWARHAADLSYQAPLYNGSTPMAPVHSTTMFVMVPACEASATFRLDGTLTMGEICIRPLEITSPANGSTLGGTRVTFQWSQAVGPITETYLSVGTTPGGSQIYSQFLGTSQLQKEVGGIPIDGRAIYVRLMSYIQGQWHVRDYAYTAATNIGPFPSEMANPLPDFPLQSSEVTFSWTTGTHVTSRTLSVGITPGGTEFYGPTEQGTALSRTVSNLPQDGTIVWVRFTQIFGGVQMDQDFAYQTLFLASPSWISSPPRGSTLSSTTTFFWVTGAGVEERYFSLGSVPGGTDIYGGYQGGAVTRTVSGIPQDGRTLYARLSSWLRGEWRSFDYTFVAAGSAPLPPIKSNLTSPTQGVILPGSTVTWQWDAGRGVTERYFSVGTSPGASDIYGGYQGAALSRTLSNVPTNGATIYATLSSWVNGGWQASSATYSANGTGPVPLAPTKSEITSPADGSTLTGSLILQWSVGSVVAERYLMVGTAPGASDIYGGYQGTALSRTISNLPAQASVYVTLSSWVNGGWEPSSRTYSTMAGEPAPSSEPASVLTSPAGSFTLGGPSETFAWTAGAGVTERYLMVGTTSGGSQIYAGYQGAALSRVVPAMPAAGTRIYVRLMSYVDGAWLVRDREYTVGP